MAFSSRVGKMWLPDGYTTTAITSAIAPYRGQPR